LSGQAIRPKLSLGTQMKRLIVALAFQAPLVAFFIGSGLAVCRFAAAGALDWPMIGLGLAGVAGLLASVVQLEPHPDIDPLS